MRICFGCHRHMRFWHVLWWSHGVMFHKWCRESYRVGFGMGQDSMRGRDWTK